MKLEKKQARALEDLGRKLKDGASRISSGKPVIDPGSPVQIQYANTFGLLGPRGAGKSTLLATVHKAWCLPTPSTREKREDDLVRLNDLLGDLLILRPLDCSILSAEIAPGAAILLHLERELEAPGAPELDAKLKKELRRLSEQYGETTDNFRTLAAELAATVGEYNRQITDATRNRLGLGEAFADWLKDALKHLEKRALVVLLDDFDLVHAREVRRWLFSLLDELHQERLLVVLTADFYRLEHLSFDPKAEIDDLTGRALLDKLLPSQNRINLERWELGARSAFGFTDDSPKVEDRIRQYSFDSEPQMRLLTRLLPGWPRGLLNLLSSLDAEQDQPSVAAGPTSRVTDRRVIKLPDDPSVSTRRFLYQLASCRGEPLLARELQEIDLASWVTALRFKEQTESVEAWQESVVEASSRGSSGMGRTLAPLSILRPDLPKAKARKLSAYTLQADMSGRDLLRHEELRARPLKDADERLAPVWVEGLLNYALAEDSPLNEGKAVWNRIRFVTHWPPVGSRFTRSRFRVRLGRQAQRSFFEDYKIPASALLWLRWDKDLDSEMSIGWDPLLSALRGERPMWQVEAMKDLLIDPRRLRGSLPPPGDARSLSIIPDQVWAIILLTDGLDRCPWEALSLPLGWELRTYVALAILLVRTAFMYALDCISELPIGLFEADDILLQTLKSRDPLRLLSLKDEEVIKLAGKEVKDLESRLRSKADPLSKAALSFLKSEPCKALNELVPVAKA